MPVSEAEKLGVTVLGCHFNGKAEHVPIKKRRFLFRSSSPPPISTSPRPQETDRLMKSECDLGQGSHPDSMTTCQVVAVDVSSANDLGQIAETNVDVDVKKLGKINNHVCANEALYGISILAAACGNSLGHDDGVAEVDSGVEDSTAKESPPGILSNNESCYFLHGLSKEDVSFANVSSEGTGSCISKVPAEESIATLREDKSSSNSPSHGNIIEGTSLQDYSGAVAQELISKDDRTVRTHKISSRDDRLHWDLNTAMDAWEFQFDNQVVDPKTKVADAILNKTENGKLSDKMENTKENYLQGEPGVLETDIEKTLPSISGEITQQTRELQVDHDSQYEDGELRESIEHTWEEYDVEDGEAEHVDYGLDDKDMYSFDAADHHVSMSEGTGCKNHHFADTNNSCYEGELSLKNVQESSSRSCLKAFTMSKDIAASSKERANKTCQPCVRPQASAKDPIDESDIRGQVDKELGTSPDKLITDNEMHAGKDDLNDSNQSVDLNIIQIGPDRLPESCKSTLDIATGVGVCSDRKNRTGDGMDAENSDAKVVGSREIKKELQSHVNGLANPGMFLRKDRPQGSRFNDVDDSEVKSVRDWRIFKSFGRGRDSQNIHYQSWRVDHRAVYPEGHRGFKRRFSPSFHGPMNFSQQGPENVNFLVCGKVEKDSLVASNGATGKPVSDGPSDHNWRQTTYPSSHGAGGPMKRSGSPADRYRDLGTRRGGNFSHGSETVGRGRYIRRHGPRFDDRGLRGRYHGPISDDCVESSSNYSHHLARRERSFSPIERRRDFHANRPCSKSPSRSRSRSPNGWQSPKGRNRSGFAGRFKHGSRSPNFRSRGRMQKMRSPHQRADLSTDQMIGFMSNPRRDASPQHNTRWIDERQEGVVHFREQGYRQRSSVLDRRSPARIFSRDETFGFADSQQRLKHNDYSRSMHPGRFSRMDGAGRGGPRYEGTDDDRRHGYRYGQVHPLRHRDSDGALKRFHYDHKDGFVAENNSRNKGAEEFIGRQSPKDCCSEGIDSQINAAARTSREDRGSFSHRGDGKFNAN